MGRRLASNPIIVPDGACAWYFALIESGTSRTGAARDTVERFGLDFDQITLQRHIGDPPKKGAGRGWMDPGYPPEMLGEYEDLRSCGVSGLVAGDILRDKYGLRQKAQTIDCWCCEQASEERSKRFFEITADGKHVWRRKLEDEK